MSYNPNRSFGFLTSDISRGLRNMFDKKAAKLGFTRSQWSALMHLRRKDGVNQTEIANLMEIQPISLTRIIDRLEYNGWVERRCDEKDRRVKKIFLTKKVRPLLGKLEQIRLMSVNKLSKISLH